MIFAASLVSAQEPPTKLTEDRTDASIKARQAETKRLTEALSDAQLRSMVSVEESLNAFDDRQLEIVLRMVHDRFFTKFLQKCIDLPAGQKEAAWDRLRNAMATFTLGEVVPRP